MRTKNKTGIEVFLYPRVARSVIGIGIGIGAMMIVACKSVEC